MGWALKTESQNIGASYIHHPAVARRRDAGCARAGVGAWGAEVGVLSSQM